ncbi:MAG: 30S ribosomal protein S16 [Dongiaceae bacterium]
MSLKIRMTRGGTKKRPFYGIVVADGRAPRDGRFIEKIGTYNPMLAHDNPERVKFNAERMKHWLGVGAQPSERIAIFLHRAGMGAAPVRREQTQQHLPKKKAMERAQAATDKAAAPAAAPAADAPAAS